MQNVFRGRLNEEKLPRQTVTDYYLLKPGWLLNGNILNIMLFQEYFQLKNELRSLVFLLLVVLKICGMTNL